MSPMMVRSAPTEKLPPSPLITMTLASSSSRTDLNPSIMGKSSVTPMAFIIGPFMLQRATPSITLS